MHPEIRIHIGDEAIASWAHTPVVTWFSDVISSLCLNDCLTSAGDLAVWEFIQEARDIVYAPGGYFYATLNLDVSIAVLENMLTERNDEKASEEEIFANAPPAGSSQQPSIDYLELSERMCAGIKSHAPHLSFPSCCGTMHEFKTLI